MSDNRLDFATDRYAEASERYSAIRAFSAAIPTRVASTLPDAVYDAHQHLINVTNRAVEKSAEEYLNARTEWHKATEEAKGL